MAKATTTIRQVLRKAQAPPVGAEGNYQAEYAAWFAANHALFNRVASFYFEVIQAHENVLDLGNQDALRALEMLTHTTKTHPHPVMPLSEVGEDIPAMFRRAAINAALGSARSFYSNLGKWHKRKEKAQVKGKKFTERPPVPPRSWNKSATLYAGQWKERGGSSITIKVWTGSVWSWIKVRLTGREIPANVEIESPFLIRRGNQWWLHTPIEKPFKSQGSIEKQVTTSEQTKICSLDLNLKEAQGYTNGAPLVLCHQCGIRGNADRNASLIIGQRLVERYEKSSKEKPRASLHAERGEQSPGVEVCQDVKSVGTRPSIGGARHADSNEHGTAQETGMRIVKPVSDIPHQLRFPI